MKKLIVYSTASLLVLVAVIANAFHTHQQFYPSMVALSQSRLFNVLMANAFAVLVMELFHVVRFIFLGALRDQEVEKVMENTAFFLMELFLALTVFGERYTIKTVALFVMCIFWKVFHWLAQSRLEFIEQTPAIGTGQARLAIFLAVLIFVDTGVGRILVHEMMTQGLSVKLLLLQEFMVMAVLAVSSLCRLVLHLVDARRQRRWEHKGAARFYLEIVSDLLQCIIYVGFFFIIYMHHGLPVNLVREMYVTLRNLYRTLRNFLNYRRLAANLDSRFPDATEEEVAQDPTCSICIDEMEVGDAKKLHCSHVFHRHCLRQWLERQTTCPYCRQTIGTVPPGGVPQRAREARDAAAAARADAAEEEEEEEEEETPPMSASPADHHSHHRPAAAAAQATSSSSSSSASAASPPPPAAQRSFSPEPSGDANELQEAYRLYCQSFDTARQRHTASAARPADRIPTAAPASLPGLSGAYIAQHVGTFPQNILLQQPQAPAAAPTLAEALAYKDFHSSMSSAYARLAEALEEAKEVKGAEKSRQGAAPSGAQEAGPARQGGSEAPRVSEPSPRAAAGEPAHVLNL